MDESTRPSQPTPPQEVGEGLFEAFMQFSMPLALVASDGRTVLANRQMLSRFGGALFDAQSMHAAASAESVCRALTLIHDGVRETIRAEAYRLPMQDRVLVVVHPSAEPIPGGEVERLRQRIGQLERLAATDHLTGAWNRAHFDRLIEAELARSMACRQPVSLVLIDIDHFKSVNDRFGHAVGDQVLQELVLRLQSRIRASDFLFRWGGEEFAVLVSTKGYRGAERLAEDLRERVAAQPFPVVGAMTVSAGVAEHAGSEGKEAWFARLDAALYQSKSNGRNRVTVDRKGNSDEWAGLSGVSALHLVWNESYECGEPTIDEEHRQLFVLANRLIDAMANADSEPGAPPASLDEMISHVGRHFADEEAILERFGYADLRMHRAAHAGLVHRALFLKGQLRNGKATLGAVVQFLAQDVVARHLLAVDRAFFPLFAKPD